MTLAISSTVSAALVPAPASIATTIGQASSTSSAADTVTLSQPAQVSQLSAQGQSPAEIAEQLGIPVYVVDIDLGISASSATASSAAAVQAVTTRAAAAPKTSA